MRSAVGLEVHMSLVDRVRNICLTPSTEWPVIEQENVAPVDLVTSYVAPLAAIGAVAGLIGSVLLSAVLPFASVGLFAGLTVAVMSFAISILMCFLLAFIVNALAPTFGGRQDFNQAFKVTAYSYTPAFVAGIAGLIPILGGFVGFLASLYSLYVLYLGLPVLMKSAREKTAAYVIVIVVCAIVLGFILFGIMGLFVGASLMGSRMFM